MLPHIMMVQSLYSIGGGGAGGGGGDLYHCGYGEKVEGCKRKS